VICDQVVALLGQYRWVGGGAKSLAWEDVEKARISKMAGSNTTGGLVVSPTGVNCRYSVCTMHFSS